MKLTAVYEPCTEGGYTAWLEELPEVISEGDTLEQAEANLRDALSLTLELRHEEAAAQRKAGAVVHPFDLAGA